MRRIASLVALLVLLGAAAPVLACATGSAMSQQDSSCCRAMHRQCGEMAKTGCCRVEVRHDLKQLATQTASATMSWSVVSFVPPVNMVPSSSAVLVLPVEESPPPGLLGVESTVLRI